MEFDQESNVPNLEHAIYREFGKLSALRAALNINHIRRDPGYWTVDSTLKELKRFCSENKNALKKHSLSRLLFEKKRSELHHATQKFGGLRKLNESFDLGLKLSRINYWTEEKIIEELKNIYHAGHKITDRTLRALKRHDLSGAIGKRGSIAYFKKKMGLPVKEKTNWSKRKIIKTYKELFCQLGTIPTVKQLRENGCREMEYAIYGKFGRLSSLRTAANLVDDRNPPGYWTLEKTVAQFKAFCIENRNELNDKAVGPLLKDNNPKLFAAVNEFGGFKKLNKKFKLGLKLACEDWTAKEISAELKKLQSAGIAINERNLRKLNSPYLKAAIVKKLQSTDYRKKMRLSARKCEKWSKEKVIEEYRTIYLQRGKFPSSATLCKMGKSGLLRASFLFFKNINAIKEILYIPIDRKERNYWTLENTVKEFKIIIEADPNYKGDMIKKLKQQNRHDLVSAIAKHKGLRELNEKFDLNLNLKKLTWSQEEVLRELETLSNKGITITQASLAALGRNDLLGAAAKFRGLNVFKHKLGLAITRKNYWTDEKIIKELKPIIAGFGRIPSYDVLKAMGKSDLACAIKKRGRVTKFSHLLNVPSAGYFKANDGHYLNSGYECLFDNILFKYNIPHIVNERICPTANYRYDFLIGNTYIEICGYDKREHPNYFKRLALKKELYEKLNLKYKIIPKVFFLKKFDIIEKEVLKIAAGVLPSQSFVSTPIHNDIIPNHYWKSLKNVKKELLPLVEKYGRIPFDRELKGKKIIPDTGRLQISWFIL